MRVRAEAQRAIAAGDGTKHHESVGASGPGGRAALGPTLITTPSAKSRIFSAHKAQGKHWPKP